MHSTSGSESARRMAQWRATGGAGEEPAGVARSADDRLAAVSGTNQYGHICIADDGLAARMGTAGGAPSTLCAVDDGPDARS